MPDDWQFAFTVYGWATNLSGSTTVRGNTVDFNASIIDILQHSSSLIGFMGDFEAKKGKFGFFADVVWAQLGSKPNKACSSTSVFRPIPDIGDAEPYGRE